MPIWVSGAKAMLKLKLAIILPIFMLCLAFPVSWQQGRVDARLLPKREYPVISHATSVYRGLNGPAVLFEGLCRAVLPIDRVDHPPLVFLGVSAGQILFFIGIALLWFGTGLSFDRRLGSQSHPGAEWTLWRIAGNLLLLAFAITLFGGGVFAIRHGNSDPIEDHLIQGILFLGWSIVLALASGHKLATGFYRMRSRSTTR
jgi:hypothetical protein